MILPAPPGAGSPPPGTVIAGLPLVRRIVLAAERAGFERILVHPRACPEPHLLAGTAAALLDADTPVGSRARLVLVPANVLPQARWLRALREMPLDPETLAVDSPAVGATHPDAPYCYQCGVQMQRAGSCHACPSCGTTSGCS